MTEKPWPPLSLATSPKPYVLAAGTPALLPIVSGLQLFDWYRLNLCGKELVDPRGLKVCFMDSDFVHLVKLIDKYGKSLGIAA